MKREFLLQIAFVFLMGFAGMANDTKAQCSFGGDLAYDDMTLVRLHICNGDASKILNGAGSAVTIASILGYTPYNGGTNPNGYLTSEVDGSTTNEIQTLSLVGSTLSISSGNNVTLPSAPGNDNATAYGSGTAYTLTTTSAKVTFGTTSPSITIPAAGTYLLMPNLKLEYTGLTLAVTRTAAFKLRRTNNTAADIANATANFNAPAIAVAQNGTAGDVDIQPVIYTTTNSNDVIEMWGSISGTTLTGTMNVAEASIIAIRIK